MTHHHKKDFQVDQRIFRKTRKYLRQIEHLMLLTRELNHEEKLKIRRRNQYREQLKTLTNKYKNDEEFFNLDSTIDDSITSTIPNDSIDQTDNKAELSFESTLNEINKKFDKISLEESNETEDKILTEDNSLEKSEANDLETVEIEIDETKKVESEVKDVSKKPEKPKAKEVSISKAEIPKKTKIIKPKFEAPNLKSYFKTLELEDAHEDLIVSIDLCAESNLIVTGSRDTSLKVWSFENAKKIALVHSFGGHTSPITLVKFWKYEWFKRCLENISKKEEDYDIRSSFINPEDADILLSTIAEKDDKLPFVVSSSLDQTIRIWDISNGECLKEFYLYNRVNHFSIHETFFAVGLDGGKIQFWQNLTQVVSSKAFDDIDMITCVKLTVDNNIKKLYALSHRGIIKVFNINMSNKNVLGLLEESDIFSLLSVSYSLKKNFNCFEVLNNDQIILINDNQSFVIFHDIKKQQCMLISTNTNNYGFTNCFFKLDNNLYISAYNIDDASANINVFNFEKEINNPKTQIAYDFTMTDSNDSHNSCISTLSGCYKDLANKSSIYIASGASKAIKLWSLGTSMNVPANYCQVKYSKMCKQANIHFQDHDDSESECEDDDDKNENDDSDTETTTESKKYCSVQ